jgi:hypothetical protein
MEGVICQGNKISTIILIFKCKTKDRMKPISFNTNVLVSKLEALLTISNIVFKIMHSDQQSCN